MIETFSNTSTGSRRAGRFSLDVVLAYEDFAAGMHGLRTFDRLFLGGGLGNPGGKRSIWKFNLLEIGSLARTATAEATTADMVIISAHGPGNLTPAVKRWAQSWVKERKASTGALVLLLDGVGKERQLPVEGYLKDCAGRAAMEFFAQKTSGRHAFDDYDLATNPSRIRNLFEEVRQVMEVASSRLTLRDTGPLPTL